MRSLIKATSGQGRADIPSLLASPHIYLTEGENASSTMADHSVRHFAQGWAQKRLPNGKARDAVGKIRPCILVIDEAHNLFTCNTRQAGILHSVLDSLKPAAVVMASASGDEDMVKEFIDSVNKVVCPGKDVENAASPALVFHKTIHGAPFTIGMREFRDTSGFQATQNPSEREAQYWFSFTNDALGKNVRIGNEDCCKNCADVVIKYLNQLRDSLTCLGHKKNYAGKTPGVIVFVPKDARDEVFRQCEQGLFEEDSTRHYHLLNLNDQTNRKVLEEWAIAGETGTTLVMIHHYNGSYSEGADLPPGMLGLALVFGQYYVGGSTKKAGPQKLGHIASQQAAGRVVRGPYDHGVVVYVDKAYEKLTPLNTERWADEDQRDFDSTIAAIRGVIAQPHPPSGLKASVLRPACQHTNELVCSSGGSSIFVSEPGVSVMDLCSSVTNMTIQAGRLDGGTDNLTGADSFVTLQTFEILARQYPKETRRLRRLIGNLSTRVIVSQILSLFYDQTYRGLRVDVPMLRRAIGGDHDIPLFAQFECDKARAAIKKLQEWASSESEDYGFAADCKSVLRLILTHHDDLGEVNGRADYIVDWMKAHNNPADHADSHPALKEVAELFLDLDSLSASAVRDRLLEKIRERGSIVMFKEVVHRATTAALAQFTHSVLQSLSVKLFVTMRASPTVDALFHAESGPATQLLPLSIQDRLRDCHIPHLIREMSDKMIRVKAVLAMPTCSTGVWPAEWKNEECEKVLVALNARKDHSCSSLAEVFFRSSFSFGTRPDEEGTPLDEPLPDTRVVYAAILDRCICKSKHQGVALLRSLLRTGKLDKGEYEKELKHLRENNKLLEAPAFRNTKHGRLTLIVDPSTKSDEAQADEVHTAALRFISVIERAISAGKDVVLHVTAHGRSCHLDSMGAIRVVPNTISVVVGCTSDQALYLNLNFLLHSINEARKAILKEGKKPGRLLILSGQCRIAVSSIPVNEDGDAKDEKTLLINHLPDLPGIDAFFAQQPPFKNRVHDGDSKASAVFSTRLPDDLSWLADVSCDQFTQVCINMALKAIGSVRQRSFDGLKDRDTLIAECRWATEKLQAERGRADIVSMDPVLYSEDRIPSGEPPREYVERILASIVKKAKEGTDDLHGREQDEPEQINE
ncbi:Fanconi Anemia group J protein, FANCJ [Carpediemonas membranifera]|uniref:Fanconi Anemia group J protein, FANCJ n=1 Tax=Carpediemonas membranifera TaxID=201153 RepID=A0A8J6B2M8_9EUKA|nr:Fanconi Anemia group J protein, FANCJ [Carpediemonas membranifera]|eukprot:KAG9391604.1 Fanconi Anemia group J protein, FANCJ [Carpediemonas membranifera]